MLTRENYRGIFAYPPTPFTDRSLLLDEDAVRSNIRKLADVGVHGIVMAGSSGEFFTLSSEEYSRLARILQEECERAGILSVLGTSGLSTAEVIERTSMAMELGVDGAMALQPFYFTLSEEELYKFWKDLSEACPGIGLIVYNYDWVRQNYTLENFRRLAEFPNIVGSKEAHWDFAKWLSFHTHSPLIHMSSTDAGWLVEMHKHDAAGVGSMHLSLSPHVFGKVLGYCNEGEYLKAEQELSPLTEFIGKMKLGAGRPHIFPSELADWSLYSPTARHKALVDAFGFLQAGPPRPPAIPVSRETQEKLKNYIATHWNSLLVNESDASPVSDGKLWIG
jgi:dihydrodipicolinate synthase/N-acetylneuraminate lyase